MTIELLVAGGGNMGAALVQGILRAGLVAPGSIAVVEPDAARREALADLLPDVEVHERVVASEAAVIAVKPQHVDGVVAEVVARGARRVLSIAAGVTLAQLEGAAGDGIAVIRSMPNTPALVGQGAAAIAAGTSATDADVEWARSLLGAVGTVEVVEEGMLDAVTALSGSGPAYLFLVAEALAEAGVAEGLPRDVADRLTAQLLVGSAALLARRGDPAALRQAVTSPGGTTAAGLAVLDEADLRGIVARAVAAAAARSVELGQGQS